MQTPGLFGTGARFESSIRNARVFTDLCASRGSFDSYIWSFVDGVPVVNKWKTGKEIPAVTPLAETISRDMKSLGFSFAGATIIYALLQSAGLVNDHLVSCFRHTECRVQ